VEHLREWLRAAEAARVTCRNGSEFDLLVQHHKLRLEEWERIEKARLEKLKRISFGPDEDLPIWEKEMPKRPAETVAIEKQSNGLHPVPKTPS
jgi:hypothetical protein